MLQDVQPDRAAPPVLTPAGRHGARAHSGAALPTEPPPARAPRPPRRAGAGHVGEDPFISTMWAVHPCPIFDRRNRPGPWFQFRVPYGFEWNRVQLPVPNLPRALEGLRIVHVTDFHFHRVWKSPYDELLRRIAADEPDLLLSGGDYVEDKRDYRPALPMALRLVKGFRAKLGVYGILGNHDRHWMEPPLKKQKRMELIDGVRKEIPFGDGSTTIELIGLPGVDRKELSDAFIHSIPRRREGTLRIVLSHFPDHLPRVQFALQPDLFLAGHTHGGQVCLPGGHPIITHSKLPRRFARGVHHLDGTWLVVNRGLGFSGLPLRVLCPAEVVELTLQPGN